ncbi:MAG: hypothetical protein ACHQ2Z_10605 [Elusimicrobiota bacterium]
MKRISPKKVLSILCCSVLMSGAVMPVFAQVATVRLPGAAAGVSGAAAVGTNFANPALSGVPSMMGTYAPRTLLPVLSAPSALVPAAIPVAAAPALAPASLPAAADGPAIDPLAAAKGLSSRVTPATGEQAGSEKAAAASDQTFDGSVANAAAEAVPTAANGAPLNRLYPKVVFIQDVFSGPAPESVATGINRMIDAGVHVVFMTWRPQKGPGSAEEVLLSRVKQSRANPVVVVAFNGGKIALHGRSANPKAIVENVGQFSAENIAKIQELANKIGARTAALVATPTEKEAFSLTLTIGGQSRDTAFKVLNAEMNSAGLPYRAEANPDDATSIIIHSMPLRFSVPRVLDALESQFPGENILAQPEKFLVLADSMKSLRFSTAFPKLAEIQVTSDGAGVSSVLGAVLGDRKLETITIKLGKLRQYAEFWEPSRHYVAAIDSEARGGGGGGSSAKPEDRKSSQMLSMFVGTVINRLMAKIYENIRNGQHQFTATPWALQKQLEAMWYKPIENGVYVNKQLAIALATVPNDVKKGYLEKASAFVSNFYARELAAYPAGAAHVMLNLVSINTDRKSAIMLEFKSSSTGKIYKIHTRIPRVMRQSTSEGVTLTAYGYRTGKETADEGEEFLSRMYAIALLKGHARKGPDGKWHQGSPNGPAITKLVVQFERHTSARIKVYDASEFDMMEENGLVEGPIVSEITSAIERMEADPAYQEYYRVHEEEAKKEDLEKPQAAKSEKGKKPKTAKRAAKPAKRTPSNKGAK